MQPGMFSVHDNWFGDCPVERKALGRHIRTLATLPQADALVISCSFNIQSGLLTESVRFLEQVTTLRSCLEDRWRLSFDEANRKIRNYLSVEASPLIKGLAVFARSGSSPFMTSLGFRVPLPHWILAGPTPNIYHLVELEYAFTRYVLVEQ